MDETDAKPRTNNKKVLRAVVLLRALNLQQRIGFLHHIQAVLVPSAQTGLKSGHFQT